MPIPNYELIQRMLAAVKRNPDEPEIEDNPEEEMLEPQPFTAGIPLLTQDQMQDLPKAQPPYVSPFERVEEQMGGLSYQKRTPWEVLKDIGQGALLSAATGGPLTALSGALAGGAGLYRKQNFENEFQKRLAGETAKDAALLQQQKEERLARGETLNLEELERKKAADIARAQARERTADIKERNLTSQDEFRKAMANAMQGKLDVASNETIRKQADSIRNTLANADFYQLTEQQKTDLANQLNQIDNLVLRNTGNEDINLNIPLLPKLQAPVYKQDESGTFFRLRDDMASRVMNMAGGVPLKGIVKKFGTGRSGSGRPSRYDFEEEVTKGFDPNTLTTTTKRRFVPKKK